MGLKHMLTQIFLSLTLTWKNLSFTSLPDNFQDLSARSLKCKAAHGNTDSEICIEGIS